LFFFGPRRSVRTHGPKRGGAFRILQTTDTVRAELEAALECRIPIIPVLVDDAPMPAEKEFPESLKSLAFAASCGSD
jgi:hypothetical protein